ncbi:MAG: hypothetical protein Udaeo2_04420 [Candidatus Udaeobacter sp.]|nr:MAG: hypothetical protein Udaeo2_04420 [Candidatus Udaeobacter sp.]
MAYLYFRNFVEVLEQAGGLKRVALTLGIAATALFSRVVGHLGRAFPNIRTFIRVSLRETRRW